MFHPTDQAEQRYYMILPCANDERGYIFVVPVSLSGGLTDIFSGRKRTTVYVLPSTLGDKICINFHDPLRYLDELQQNLYK